MTKLSKEMTNANKKKKREAGQLNIIETKYTCALLNVMVVVLGKSNLWGQKCWLLFK